MMKTHGRSSCFNIARFLAQSMIDFFLSQSESSMCKSYRQKDRWCDQNLTISRYEFLSLDFYGIWYRHQRLFDASCNRTQGTIIKYPRQAKGAKLSRRGFSMRAKPPTSLNNKLKLESLLNILIFTILGIMCITRFRSIFFNSPRTSNPC